MDKLEANIELSEESLERLADAILEDLDSKVQEAINDCDLDDKFESVIDEYDFDDKMDRWFDYNVDINDLVRDAISDIDLSEYVDIDEGNIEGPIRSLMNNFSPINACSTGQAAMDVIKSTIRYFLIKDNSFVADIQDALNKHQMRKMMEEAKNEIIEEVKPMLRQQFQLELTQYADAIEAEKAREILRAQENANQQTTSIPLDIV